jgi:hypothetical protein
MEQRQSMTRRVRGLTLLVALSLLTSAATAYAERAWVLWYGTSTSPDLTPTSGHTTKSACRNAMVRDHNEVVRLYKYKTDLEVNADSITIVAGNEQFPFGDPTIFEWRCLPDTVDPRGPKGK